jgi:hypothetical protein
MTKKDTSKLGSSLLRFLKISLIILLNRRCGNIRMVTQEGFQPIVQIATDDILSLEKVDVFLKWQHDFFSFLSQSFENIL